MHIVSLVVDPHAGVGVGGALVPGLSEYRSSAVALGTLATYALLVTALTARYTRLLPAGVWLKLHRLSLVVLVLAWMHGILAGTDSGALQPLYVALVRPRRGRGRSSLLGQSAGTRGVEQPAGIAVGTPSRPATRPQPVSTPPSPAASTTLARRSPVAATIPARIPGGDR